MSEEITTQQIRAMIDQRIDRREITWADLPNRERWVAAWGVMWRTYIAAFALYFIVGFFGALG